MYIIFENCEMIRIVSKDSEIHSVYKMDSYKICCITWYKDVGMIYSNFSMKRAFLVL